jgi:hypothetical protein
MKYGTGVQAILRFRFSNFNGYNVGSGGGKEF